MSQVRLATPDSSIALARVLHTAHTHATGTSLAGSTSPRRVLTPAGAEAGQGFLGGDAGEALKAEPVDEYEDDFHAISEDTPTGEISEDVAPTDSHQTTTPGTPTLDFSCQSNYTQNASLTLTPAKDGPSRSPLPRTHLAYAGREPASRTRASWASPAEYHRRGRVEVDNKVEKQAVRVEWESLADDLLLEDWKEEEVADMEQLAVAALVRDGSGYYSDDFEPLSDESAEQ